MGDAVTPAVSSRQALEAAIVQSRESLAGLIPRAIDTLEELMDDDQQPGAVRLGAAKDLLDRSGVSTKTSVEIESRATGNVEGLIEAELARLARSRDAAAARAAAEAGEAGPPEPLALGAGAVGSGYGDDEVVEAELVED